MKANYTLTRIWGIPIRINISLIVFLPILAWLIGSGEQIALYADVINALTPAAVDPANLDGPNERWVVGIIAAVGLFASVTFHELGHSWVAMRYDIGVESITLWILGGLASLERMPEEWNREFWIAVAGPASSLLLAGICIGALYLVPSSLTLVVFMLGFLAVMNIVLAVFNMLPAFPMDGGRVLRALLARSRPYAEATQTAAAVGKLMAVLMAVFAVLAFAPLLLLIAMFVYVAAGAESRTTVVRELLKDMTARELMSTEIRTVTPETTVAEFLDRVLTERTTAYPVMDRGTVTGVVTLDSVRKVPEKERESTTVADVMGAAPASVSPDSDAFGALMAMSTARGERVLVVEDGRFVGQITASDFMTALEVMQGLGPRREVELPDGYA